MKPSELRGMSLDELRGELADQQRALYNLRFRKSVGEDIHPTETKNLRREIARINTIITEKETQLQVEAAGKSNENQG
ncbi:MAG TPA: 50S ribosomal protein L29 [Planctomycetota bacterium]|nr:50S ribosomal protein L29 [Planctomycetota bacterium]